MRLKETQVKRLCAKFYETLRSRGLAKPLVSDGQVQARMEELFLRDLRLEDEINKEAHRLVEEYIAKAPGGPDSIDRQKLFLLIKRQLVKDRNVVL
jgi:hypothetical protein